MSYQVFARKYRPQTFDEVVGQEHITQTLKNAIQQNRLAHAYLFVGPRGIGKTSTARILAKALNCYQGPTAIPCNQCDSCKEITQGNNLDVLEIDGASNNGVEQVRELRDNVQFAPTRGKFRLYIIDEVHMLTSAAFNALLKTLEEPPPHAKFIFATTEPQKVLPTILSRCQRFDLRRIPANLIARHLLHIANSEGIALSEAAAHAIAKGADGGLRDAESMLDQLVAFCGGLIEQLDVMTVFGFTPAETVANLLASIIEENTTEALALLHTEADAGKDLMKLLGDLITHLRNVLVAQVDPESLSEDASPDLNAMIRQQAAATEPARMLALIDQFAAAEGRMRWAPNKKLHFEIAIIRAVQSIANATLDEVIETLGSLRGGDAGSPARIVDKREAPKLQRMAVAPLPVRSARAPLPPVGEPVKPTPPPAPVPVAVQPVPAPIPTPPEPDPEPEPEPQPSNFADFRSEPEYPFSAGEPEMELEPEPEPPKKALETVDGPTLWFHLQKEFSATRPLLLAWVQSGAVESFDGRKLVAAFPATERIALESLMRPASKANVEAALSKLAGAPIEFHGLIRDGVVVAAPVEFPPEETEEPKKDPMEELKNDPLIKKALDTFKAVELETAK